MAFARVSARKSFYKLLSNHLCRSIFLVMFYAFSIFFWTALDRCVWIMKIILWEPSYFRHSNNIQIVVSNCKSLIAKTFDGNVLILIAASPSYVIKNKKQCFQLFLDWPPALFLRTYFLCTGSGAMNWIFSGLQSFFRGCGVLGLKLDRINKLIWDQKKMYYKV